MPVCGCLSQRADWILRTDSALTNTSKLLLTSSIPTYPWEVEDGKEERCWLIGYGWVLDELHCLLLISTCPSSSLPECSPIRVQPINHMTFSTPTLVFRRRLTPDPRQDKTGHPLLVSKFPFLKIWTERLCDNGQSMLGSGPERSWIIRAGASCWASCEICNQRKSVGWKNEADAQRGTEMKGIHDWEMKRMTSVPEFLAPGSESHSPKQS